jgi:hypothetical protein
MPGYATGRVRFEDYRYESLSLASALNHAGGPITLRCKELSGNVDVGSATLSAIKVSSIG